MDEPFVRDTTAFQPSPSEAGQAQPPTTRSTSPEEPNTENSVKLDEYSGLNRPNYFFAKIDAFFAGHRSTDGESFILGPFPTLPHSTTPARDGESVVNQPLSIDQHAYFLRLFREAYHPLLQVPNESEFRGLYDSLWQQGLQEPHTRRALIDCMTALGMQYGYGAGLVSRILGLRLADRRVGGDISWAGFEYFCRCRNYVTQNMDRTLAGMQCYALMVLYLMNASDFQTAYSMLGTAVRNAHGANLHREPDEHIPAELRDMRRRVWWLLFTLDIRCSLQLRKPVAVQPSVITCALPGDTFSGIDSGYFIHAVKLAIALSNIDRIISTYDMCAEASNIAALEHRAALLASSLEHLEQWRLELPPDLLSARREAQALNPSQAMSIAESPLVLEPGVPTTLHRQRVLLEVHYHNAYIMVQRPFICFPRDLSLGHFHQPQTDQHTRSALQHAVVMATIIHDVCSNSDALFGWPEILQPLWNATATIFAFILANPLCGRSPGARYTITKVLTVFEAFATTDSLAARAKEITRTLSSRLDETLAISGQWSYTTNRGLPDVDEGLTANNVSNEMSPDPTPLTATRTPNQIIALDDESLHSWITTLDSDMWKEYQNGLDSFLGSPLEDFAFDTPQRFE